MRKILASVAIVLVMVGFTGASATTLKFPWANAVLNADKSAVVATASNTDDKNYSCMITGRIRVKDQRAFSMLQCTFSLPANAAERQVCVHEGTGPGSLASIEGVKATCVPN